MLTTFWLLFPGLCSLHGADLMYNLQGCHQDCSVVKSLTVLELPNFVVPMSKHQDKWVCMQVVSSINNLIIGKIYVDHGGVMRITSSATGMVCKLKFREQGILSRHEAHEVCALLRHPLAMPIRSPAAGQMRLRLRVLARCKILATVRQPCMMHYTHA